MSDLEFRKLVEAMMEAQSEYSAARKRRDVDTFLYRNRVRDLEFLVRSELPDPEYSRDLQKERMKGPPPRR